MNWMNDGGPQTQILKTLWGVQSLTHDPTLPTLLAEKNEADKSGDFR